MKVCRVSIQKHFSLDRPKPKLPNGNLAKNILPQKLLSLKSVLANILCWCRAGAKLLTGKEVFSLHVLQLQADRGGLSSNIIQWHSLTAASSSSQIFQRYM